MDPWARFVVTASSDGTARVWDLSSARTVHVLLTGVTQEQGEAAEGGVGCLVGGALAGSVSACFCVRLPPCLARAGTRCPWG